MNPDQVDADQERSMQREPTTMDFMMAYFMWILAGIIPGLHHFYLGNFWRGLKYLFTFNEVYAGWLLDLFELHVLVQKSVQEYGHTTGICGCCSSCCATCWWYLCCCWCCFTRRSASTETAATAIAVPLNRDDHLVNIQGDSSA